MLRKKENERKQQVSTNFFQYFEKKFLPNACFFPGLLVGHILPSFEGRTSFCFLFVFFLDHLLIEIESLKKRLRKYFFVIYAVFPFFSRKPQTWISKSESEFCLWISKFYMICGIHVSQGSTGSDMALFPLVISHVNFLSTLQKTTKKILNKMPIEFNVKPKFSP